MDVDTTPDDHGWSPLMPGSTRRYVLLGPVHPARSGHEVRLPYYAPDLNPTETVWSHLKRSIGNLAVRGVDQLLAIVKNRLKQIQYRPDLIDAFLAHTGLTLEPHST